MQIIIEKHLRRLTLWDGERMALRCRVALSHTPEGAKQREGDGRTPEGVYHVCLVKEQGKYGQSLGLDYPSLQDARGALADGRIDQPTFDAIDLAQREGRRPPWGTPLGGEIYLHAGGASSDWTQGCIALEERDMAVLFACREQIASVIIQP